MVEHSTRRRALNARHATPQEQPQKPVLDWLLGESRIAIWSSLRAGEASEMCGHVATVRDIRVPAESANARRTTAQQGPAPTQQPGETAVLDSPRIQSSTGFWGCSRGAAWGAFGALLRVESSTHQSVMHCATRHFACSYRLNSIRLARLWKASARPQRRIRAVSAPPRFPSNEQS